MEFDKLKSFLTTIGPLATDDWQLIRSELRIQKFDKHVKLLNQTGICNSIMYLNSGIARSYVIDEKGRDYTCSFNFNNNESSLKNLFLTDYASVIKEEQSTLFFESLTELEVVVIPVNYIKKLYEINHNWNRIGRVIAEEAYYITQRRTLSLLTKTATERYEELSNTLSSFMSEIPDVYLASYLGITPQSLSRIKKNYRELPNGNA